SHPADYRARSGTLEGHAGKLALERRDVVARPAQRPVRAEQLRQLLGRHLFPLARRAVGAEEGGWAVVPDDGADLRRAFRARLSGVPGGDDAVQPARLRPRFDLVQTCLIAAGFLRPARA